MGDRETDMTADNIAPDDEPTPDPANTRVEADGAEDSRAEPTIQEDRR